MTKKGSKPCHALRAIPRILCFFVLALLFGGMQLAIAQDGTGDTTDSVCMDNLFGSPEGGELNCTANDVRVSGVADVTGDGIVDEQDIMFKPVCDLGAQNPGDDCSETPNDCRDSSGNPAPELCGDRCAFAGDTTTFAATFIVELNAQERFDIGLYFAKDGDLNGDGALTGSCSISSLPEVGPFTRPDGSTGSFVDLDTSCKGGNCPQPEDLCGDIDNANNPIFYDLSMTGNFFEARCVDFDGDGQLNLPNCTSWRQSGANEVCKSPLGAFPGSPSKCNCDPAFQVPIQVPAAELLVTKTATPTSLDEPGGTVTFNIEVENTGIDPANHVTLDSPDGLTDDIYGDITTVGHDGITSTTCSLPQTITGDGGTYTCSFTVDLISPGDTSETDTVTASGTDDNGNTVKGSDDATVIINNVIPAISVVKDVSPTSVLEPGGDVTFTVVVSNDSTATSDPLTITSLWDDMYGDLSGLCLDTNDQSLIGQTIPFGGSVSCTFSATVNGNANDSETSPVTAYGMDDEGYEVSASDSATVSITGVPSMIELLKTASPTAVQEPGGDITFTFMVTNASPVDTVTINSLTDDKLGDLNGQGDCAVPQVIPAGESYSCSFTKFLPGNGGDLHLNKATASGVDDDGEPVKADDDATVNFTDAPPAASLSKTATMVVATFRVVVSNDSPAEMLRLEALHDDTFGDITQADGDIIQRTSCSVSQNIPVGESYTCSFDARVTTSPHTNTVIGEVSDDDGGIIFPFDSATVSFE